jgi:hypothetical protein
MPLSENRLYHANFCNLTVQFIQIAAGRTSFASTSAVAVLILDDKSQLCPPV